MSDSTVKLYKWTKWFDRQGTLSGVLTATDEEMILAEGETAYFGSVLGKHSEVVYTVDPNDFECLSDDLEFIQKVVRMGLCHGTDPIDTLKHCPGCCEFVGIGVECADCCG